MNPFTTDHLQRIQAQQDRFGLRLGAALTALLAAKPDRDIVERLRFARERALAQALASRRMVPATSLAGAAGGAAVMAGPGDGDTPWWLRLSSLLPLALLLAGLMLIDHHYSRAQIEAAAEVDAAILADDLPPEAYGDAGFLEYLRSARR